MLTNLGKRVHDWANETDPWTNVYGLARTLLALGTLFTLLLNPTTDLFRPALGVMEAPVCSGVASAGLFCQLASHGDTARWLAIASLALVASGWRPRVTGFLHWYVVWSLFTSAVVIDGGDQITANLTLLLLPVTLCDSRTWHWQPSSAVTASTRNTLARLVARFSFVAVRIQVAGIYFHAAVGKLDVAEWADGTAVYYWFTHPTYGAAQWLAPAIEPLLLNPITVTMITWGAILLETLLFAALFMDRKHWPVLLSAGIAFHVAIAVCHGLVSFGGFAMPAALVLYLRPKDAPLRRPAWLRWPAWFRRLLLRLRPRRVTTTGAPSPRRPAGAHTASIDAARFLARGWRHECCEDLDRGRAGIGAESDGLWRRRRDPEDADQHHRRDGHALP